MFDQDIVSLKKEVEELEKQIQKKNEARSEITAKLQEKKHEKEYLSLVFRRVRCNNDLQWLKNLRKEEMHNLQKCLDEIFRSKNSSSVSRRTSGAYGPVGDHVVLDMKRKQYTYYTKYYHELHKWSIKMWTLRRSLDKYSESKNIAREKSIRSNSNVKIMYSKTRHGKNNLAMERIILQEMKQMEPVLTKEVVNAETSLSFPIPDYLGSKEDIRKRIKLIREEAILLDKENQDFIAYKKRLSKEIESAEKDICSLHRKLVAIGIEKQRAYESILQLQTKEENTSISNSTS